MQSLYTMTPAALCFIQLDSLAQAHLAEDEKERAKEILGMKTVPFYVVVGQASEEH